jgi:hypothetical protein
MDALRSTVRDFADAPVNPGGRDQSDAINALLAGDKLRASDLFGYTRAIKPGSSPRGLRSGRPGSVGPHAPTRAAGEVEQRS